MDLKILEIASNTENHKVVKNHTHSSKNKNPICGDEIEIKSSIFFTLLDLYFKTLYLEFIKIFYFNVYFCHDLNFKALDIVLKGKSKHSFLDIFFLLRIFLNSSHSLLILISVFSKKASTEVNKLII